ncbi:phospho-N-acetylmuramoyl-pentapeptide-transferase [Caproiciproducens galactitolivorans]|uniref:Phospho-N-acetylmuramoyl-pentapeptide-transferase n=1 Tax=Caproiciproducens galactitolivorans TaxID=642589 RepID=A0ABT4BPL6_9FIRM|nr:phospho-N-acetylmuramoyl-pentapeptide-transferase [Caproiciproducens galactitolivorans]MCY1712754.1 phospho-N-acetylmuramoyl-pentapeptide-transferase [Caproiciproducens galactitolivorans]
MNLVWTALAALLSFGITAVIGKWMVPFLHKINFGQTIREVGPKWHRKKNGTPTMGGFMFIIGITVTIVICVPLYYTVTKQDSLAMLMRTKIFGGLLMAIGFGAVGFFDDYIKVVKKRNLGLNVRQKLVLQFLIAAAYLYSLYLAGGSSVTLIPFWGSVNLGIWYWIIAFLGIVGIVNAVNFTDGIDGLNATVTFFVCLFFMLLSGMMGVNGLSIFASASAGGCLGFLIWNFNPAKVFMGDTGSLFLGGIVCALGFGLNMPILILLLGIVYICEILSVVLQVSYFKATHGKRLFKMSPIHHHFELCGWSEIKICRVFALVTVLCGICSALLVYYGF